MSNSEAVYWVYILASRMHGTLYVGMTADPAARIGQHRAGAVEGFTRTYKVYRLVYAERYPTHAEARQREHSLKRWRRVWKIELIESLNPDWRDLLDTFSV